MKIEGDRVIFSTGKSRYANVGVFGLSPTMEVTEGYDGTFYNGPDGEGWLLDDEEKLDHADLIELADYMIEQWKQFRRLHVDKGSDK